MVVENSKEFENDLKLRDFNINDNILIEAIIVHRGHRGQYYIEAIQISEEIEDGLFAPNLWTLQKQQRLQPFSPKQDGVVQSGNRTILLTKKSSLSSYNILSSQDTVIVNIQLLLLSLIKDH